MSVNPTRCRHRVTRPYVPELPLRPVTYDAAFQEGGNNRWRLLLSASVKGKYRESGDENKSGLHDAGRPHINFVGSLLCIKPIECPNSWAITLRATLGKDIGSFCS